ncbi:MAG: hypothetical protein QXJ07_00405 [Candidatus Bathyarchaeia archaeon]
MVAKITLIVADELHKNGLKKLLWADGHGPMVTPRVRLARIHEEEHSLSLKTFELLASDIFP